jgi:hypothetical protein
MEAWGSLMVVVPLDSDDEAGGDASICGASDSQRFAEVGLTPSEQAGRASLRRTTISIAQPFRGADGRDCLRPKARPPTSPECSLNPWCKTPPSS